MPPKVIKKAKDKLAKKLKIEVGQKILCYQANHLYEAKCLEKLNEKKTIKYKVHYKNWKSKYDEWVTEDRVLLYTEKNVKRMKALREKVKDHGKNVDSKKDSNIKQKKAKISKSNSSESASSLGTTAFLAPKKLITPPYVCKQNDFLNIQEVKIRIPEDLKPILVDDWELIVNQNKLLPLPPKHNVDKILNKYYSMKKQSSKLPLNHTIEGYENFISNLKKYFNYLVEKDLLYPMEREQFFYLKDNYDSLCHNMSKDDKLMSQKESRRAWRKHKKSRKHQIIKLPSVTSESSNSNCPPKTPTSSSIDNNSQSEISDSSENTSKEQTVLQPDKEENAEVITKVDFTRLYGVIHLLRLFTKLGHFLFFTDLNEERLALLDSYIYDFLKYLSKNLWIIWNCSDASYIDSNVFTAENNGKEQSN